MSQLSAPVPPSSANAIASAPARTHAEIHAQARACHPDSPPARPATRGPGRPGATAGPPDAVPACRGEPECHRARRPHQPSQPTLRGVGPLACGEALLLGVELRAADHVELTRHARPGDGRDGEVQADDHRDRHPPPGEDADGPRTRLRWVGHGHRVHRPTVQRRADPRTAARGAIGGPDGARGAQETDLREHRCRCPGGGRCRARLAGGARRCRRGWCRSAGRRAARRRGGWRLPATRPAGAPARW